jgi:hypothetical protein
MSIESNNMFTGMRTIEPSSPFVEGLIRFAWEGNGVPEQKGVFELLTHVHAAPPEQGQVPKMQTHPLAGQTEAMDSELDEGRRHLIEVPVRILGKRVEDVLKAGYRAYDVEGRLVCHANSETAVRSDGAGGKSCVACPGPDGCEFGKQFQCQLHVRAHLAVEGSTDPYAVFEFQTSSVNSYKTLKAKLQMFSAMLDGDLSGMPLRLTSWQKSTRGSGYNPFHCANLELPAGMSIQQAETVAAATRSELRLDRLGAATEIWAESDAVDTNIVRPERAADGVPVLGPRTKAPSQVEGIGIESLVAAAKRDRGAEIAPLPVDNSGATKITADQPGVIGAEPMGI